MRCPDWNQACFGCAFCIASGTSCLQLLSWCIAISRVTSLRPTRSGAKHCCSPVSQRRAPCLPCASAELQSLHVADRTGSTWCCRCTWESWRERCLWQTGGRPSSSMRPIAPCPPMRHSLINTLSCVLKGLAAAADCHSMLMISTNRSRLIERKLDGDECGLMWDKACTTLCSMLIPADHAVLIYHLITTPDDLQCCNLLPC